MEITPILDTFTITDKAQAQAYQFRATGNAVEVTDGTAILRTTASNSAYFTSTAAALPASSIT